MTDVDIEEAPTGAAMPDSPLADTPAAEPVKDDPQPDPNADLRRRLAEEERARKRIEATQKKAEEAKAAEQGEWQKLAEQREAELTQERTERTRVEREQRVARAAARLKFIDTQDAVLRVRGEDGDTDDAALAALERIAEQSPHLIAKEAPVAPEIGQVLTPSAPTDTTVKPPAGKAPLRTVADAEALSDKEFTERYAEVQAVLNQPQ